MDVEALSKIIVGLIHGNTPDKDHKWFKERICHKGKNRKEGLVNICTITNLASYSHGLIRSNIFLFIKILHLCYTVLPQTSYYCIFSMRSRSLVINYKLGIGKSKKDKKNPLKMLERLQNLYVREGVRKLSAWWRSLFCQNLVRFCEVELFSNYS